MMVSVEQSVEWELPGETEVLAQNLPRCHFAHQKSHVTWPGLEPGPPRWEAGDSSPELLNGQNLSYSETTKQQIYQPLQTERKYMPRWMSDPGEGQNAIQPARSLEVCQDRKNFQ
jgi:hypothetical protein